MLQAIRNRLTGWIAIAAIILIGVPLALTFGTGDFTATGSNYAALVNGEEIPRNEFLRVYQNELVTQQQELRTTFSPEFEDELKRLVLDGFVANRVLRQYVRGARYRVADDRLADYIRTVPAFQVGGQFSRPAYEATLVAEGLSPVSFESEQREALAIRQLQDGLTESAFYTPAEFRRLMALEGERREVSWVLFDARELGGGISIPESDIEAYYSANQPQFLTAESADLEYVEIVLGEMALSYEPDEESLRQAYEADPGRFRTEEERRARHILVAVTDERDDEAAKERAGEVAARLAAGGDFGSLAAEFSDDPGSAARGGDLGWAARGAYVRSFEYALFSLPVGAMTPPVRTEFGYHLIRLDEVRAGAEMPYETVREQLRDELRRQRAQDEFYALADRLDDLALENRTSLEPVAREAGLPLRRLAGFTRAGGGGLGDNPRLVAAVFDPAVLDGEENTPLVELADGRAVVARVTAHRLPEPRPLVEVREGIVDRLRTMRAAALARERGQAVLAAALESGDLAGAAAAAGARLEEPGSVTRMSAAPPPDLLAAIFRAPRPVAGQPVLQGTELQDGSFAVFRLTGVRSGDPEAVPREQRDQRKRVFARQTAVLEAGYLAADLRSAAKVVIARDLFAEPEGS